jgi:hypothetical protein
MMILKFSAAHGVNLERILLYEFLCDVNNSNKLYFDNY